MKDDTADLKSVDYCIFFCLMISKYVRKYNSDSKTRMKVILELNRTLDSLGEEFSLFLSIIQRESVTCWMLAYYLVPHVCVFNH